MNERIFCFDIDGTLCTKDCKYEEAQPFLDVIRHLNHLYDSGNKIIVMTARGACSGLDWVDFTEKQLNGWGVKYHELIMNKKPHAHVFVDDRAVNIEQWKLIHNLG